METDLEKLRRFCLTAALVLISYHLAGLSIATKKEINPLGIPITINRSDLLPIGIAIACFLGMIRFSYYGLLLGKSPFRKRKEILVSVAGLNYFRAPDGFAWRHSNISYRDQWVYFGPDTMTIDLDVENVKRAKKLIECFPRFLRAKPRLEQVELAPGSFKVLALIIPLRSRIAAMFEDLDYTAPVWLSLLALCVFGYSLYAQPMMKESRSQTPDGNVRSETRDVIPKVKPAEVPASSPTAL